MKKIKERGFCTKCNKFYPDDGTVFGKCPEGHFLSHPNKCSLCGFIMYFYGTDDEYYGPMEPLTCQNCAKKLNEKTVKEGKNMIDLKLLRTDFENSILDSIGVSKHTGDLHFIFKTKKGYIGVSVPQNVMKTFEYTLKSEVKHERQHK